MALNLTGISNENEFYTHHYLVTILEGDLRNLFARWESQEEEQGTKPPYHQLGRLSREYFAVRGQMERAKSPGDIIDLQRRFLPDLLEALGVCRTYQSRKKWLPNLRFMNVKTLLNSLMPAGRIRCYNSLILFK